MHLASEAYHLTAYTQSQIIKIQTQLKQQYLDSKITNLIKTAQGLST